MDDLVWYVAYGSNVDARRLQCYLDGTTPEGTARAMRGARDRSPPRRDEPCRVPGRLAFARYSRLWGGGVAFLDAAGAGTALARRYLITVEQFEDLFAQENKRNAESLDLLAVPADDIEVGRGWYRRILRLAEHADHPSLTFTDVEIGPIRPPTGAYLASLVRGLHQSHGLAPGTIGAYLHAAVGDTGPWTRAALEAHAAEVLRA